MPATTNWDAIEWTQVRPGMQRKTCAGEGARLALFRIQPSQERLPHSRHDQQIVYMLRVTADFHVGEEAHRLTGGCLIVIPPNVKHDSTLRVTRRSWNSTCSRRSAPRVRRLT
ncbi:MAG: cupin domain-containing protein [Hyphomicrobiaceae bacterium]|nr:cupin domain-containing protein [Hyphomicrobiaceae bacterium]